MADFTLPELGENVAAGDVLHVLVNAGDTIAKDQPVLELETDKATIEVPSSVAGKVTQVNVKAGDKVKVGQTILTVEDGAGAPATAAPAPAAPAPAAPAPAAPA
ncbi:MAG TPA: biotin/lipoyl-containing protein, partial [Vicinamibacterales bacterium]|nr:biotin/lipoyl-containing protein [Vicinamibacterales bacterium]